MKWDTVKQTVARGVFSEVERGAGDIMGRVLADVVGSDFAALKSAKTSGKHVLTTYAGKAYERVMEWDVRRVGKLRELFPQHFPPSLRTGDLVAFHGRQ